MKKDPAAVKLGKRGAAKRNANMSKEQKREAARFAAHVRWGTRPCIVVEGGVPRHSTVAYEKLPNGNALMDGIEYDGLTGVVVRNAKLPRKKRK